jgi:hypothetical protein
MRSEGRYNQAILHKGSEASAFFEGYFDNRRVLMIGGAGFDPRACIATQELVSASADLRLQLIREHRPGPTQELTDAAESNLALFLDLAGDLEVLNIEVFDNDGAIVGGRRAVSEISKCDFSEYTDVLIDLSALSIGTSFPIVRLIVEQFVARRLGVNLHLSVAHDPIIDAQILRTAGDRPGWVHGFSGTVGVDRDQTPAKLWMPQLARGARQEINRIYEFVHPDDTCPILPFPSQDPRLADKLALEYREELLGTWMVDVRNIVYADEDDPLDVYRTILRIDDLRRPVFAGSGGSTTILSPTSSKLTALGTLMASIERDLPVAYLEAENYELDMSTPGSIGSSSLSDGAGLVHLWLEGEPYPASRPDLKREV